MAIILSLLAFYVWNRRSKPGAFYFTLFIIASAGWSVMCSFEYMAMDTGLKIFYDKMTFAFTILLAPFWLFFALDYAGLSKWLSRTNQAVIMAAPAAAILLTITNEWHRLIYVNITPATNEPGSILVYTPGIAYLIIITYSYLLTLAGLLIMVRMAYRAPKRYYSTIAIFIIGALVPFVMTILYQLEINPVTGLDYTPFGFAVTCLLYTWSIYRQRMFNLVPVARERLITNIQDGVVVLDEDMVIVDINPAAEKMLIGAGLRPGQKIDAVKKVLPGLLGILKNKEPMSQEVMINNPEKAIWANIRSSPVYSELGDLSGRIIVLQDITERKRAEEVLRKSEAHMATSQKIAHLGSFEWDLVHHNDEWSDEMYSILGVKRGDVKQSLETFLSLVHPDDLEVLQKHTEENMKNLMPRIGEEFRILDPDGTVRWVRFDSHFVFDESGQPASIFGTIMEITGRKRAEAALRESEQKFRVLTETSTASILLYQNDRLIYINHTSSEITGYTKEELLQMSLIDIIHPDHR
ncbi:MAG TPA: histidine kinase N-terminal 7TM domain-containing protein, partial [Methanocella sp.]|nr:histidine kinase N-terminal 7TM domain-containing protein [Methanocella sp.]